MMTETCQSCPNCDEIVSTAFVHCPNCQAFLEPLPTLREWIIVTLLYIVAGVMLMTCISSALGAVIWLATREIQALWICVTFGATLGFTLGVGFRLVSLFESLVKRRISVASKSYNSVGRAVMSSMVMTSIAIAVAVATGCFAGPPAPPGWQFFSVVILGGAVVGGVLGLLASGW